MVSVKSIIGIIVGIAIVGILVGGTIEFNSEKEREGVPWREASGPFQIEKYEYYLGEKIFINAIDIPRDVSGEIIFFRPSTTSNIDNMKEFEGVSKELISAKIKYLAIIFDGNAKSNFNQYFEPRFNEWTGICSANDLTGEWVMVFQGTQYKEIHFKVIDEIAPWDTRTFETLEGVGIC